MPTEGRKLAQATLEAAKYAPRARRRRRKSLSSDGGYSSSGPDGRDPQSASSLISHFIGERGWEATIATGTIFGAWEKVVGSEISSKCRPVALDDKTLTLEATSTTWATQLRLLARVLIAKIAQNVGDGVVQRVAIRGPAAPSWRKGPLVVSGRGPRDTYG